MVWFLYIGVHNFFAFGYLCAMFRLPSFSRVVQVFLHAIFPPRCGVCGAFVAEGEYVCARCLKRLEPARLGAADDNAMTRLFMGRVPVARATALLRYRPDSPVADLLMQIKYYSRPQLARELGRWMASCLRDTGIFEGVDALVPMPLTLSRRRERGYNQSEQLALGISDVVGIPLRSDIVERRSFRISQTRLTHFERWQNVQEAFSRSRDYAAACTVGEGGVQHPLLIDDVLTTGASLTSLAQALDAPKVSFLVLALAGTHHSPLLSDERIAEEYREEPYETIVRLLPAEEV